MITTEIETVAQLRAAVAYLGERNHFGWWQSEFFGTGSKAFLAPIFGKTQLLAQVNGATTAAALVHDERIGIGDVYHLFRLPEDMEQSLHRVLQDSAFVVKMEQLLTDHEQVVALLQTLRNAPADDAVGPTRIGNLHQLRSADAWAIATAHYGRAFERGEQTYPYFSTSTS